MIIGKPAPFVRTFIDAVDQAIRQVRIPVIPATQSGAKLPSNPKEACHPIHRIAATQST